MSKWGDSIRRKTVDNIRGNRALFFATTGTMAQMSERIWGRGELSSGGKIQYDEDYELWAYKPPSPRAVTGKGKPYEDWIVRSESISERRSALTKRANKAAASFKKTGSERSEVRAEIAFNKLDEFKARFGKDARNIKGGYYPTYLAYKEQQGRKETPFDLTSSLRLDWLGGVSPTPNDVDPLLCTISVSERNSKKIEGLTKKKGAFVLLSEEEKREHVKRLRDIYAEGLNA